jgi:NADPH:quinone reductase-like Zn-dependent oxidoreductase/acetyl esterase/lipase
MKAARFTRFGGPEVLEVAEVPEPHAGPGEVRIAVHAAGIGLSDLKKRQGLMGQTLPQTMGYEAAGVVDELGEGATGVAVGDRVFGFDASGAAQAEVAVLSDWAPIPASLDFAAAAALPAAVETAVRALDHLGVHDGSTLLINGASGSVGSAAVQFAVARGARVIGTANKANHDFVRSMGAEPVEYGEGLTARVRALCPGGVDLALDVAGSGVLPELIDLAGGAGHVVTIADFAGARQHGVAFSRGEDGRAIHALAQVGELIESERFRLPPVHTYPLGEIAAAHRVSEQGRVRGKLVLLVATIPRPPYDVELLAMVPTPEIPPFTRELIAAMRSAPAPGITELEPALARTGVRHEERTVSGPYGDIVLSIFTPPVVRPGMPAMYSIHGGGMIAGNRFGGLDAFGFIDWVAEFGMVLISPEYHLAPEVQGTALAEDCHAGLAWTFEHAAELSVDPSRIVLAGFSGGGGLAASTALLNRDRGGPAPLAQLLICPQLDDRGQTVSARQFSRANGARHGLTAEHLAFAWDMVLGEGHRDAAPDPVAVPARALDLTGLPQAYIDAGSAEVFRDEAVQYATRLWAAGSQVELHIWAGGWHGFEQATTAEISIAARAARKSWMRRVLAA